MSSTAKRVIKNTGFLYAKTSITMFISLYATRLILNSLGASDFGIFNIVGGAIAMLGFLNGAMASATQRFMSYSEGEGNKEKQKCIFNISLALHFVISILVGIILLAAGFVFFNGVLNIPSNRIFAAQVVYGSLIVSTMFTVMTVPYDAVMNAHENMKYYALVGIIESLLKLFVAFVCVYTFYDKLIVYGILMACIPLITLTIMRIYCHRHYAECAIALRKYWDKSTMKEMISFAGWNFMTSILGLLSHQGTGLVLNHFFGTIVNAAQGITYQLSGQLGVLSTQTTKALNPPIIKKAGAHQLDQMYNIASLGSKITLFMTTVIFLPFLLNQHQFLTLWLVNVPEYTSIFIFFYFMTNIVDSFGLFFITSINGIGKIKQINLFNSFISLFPFFGSILFFAMDFPPYWAYILMLISAVFKLCIRIYYSHKICHFNLTQMLLNDVLRPMSCIVFFFSFCWVLKPETVNSDIILLILFSILSMLLYTVLTLYITLNSMERNKIYSMAYKILKRINQNGRKQHQ